MSEEFHLIDLISQAGAVQKMLAAKTDSEKLVWLSRWGKVIALPVKFPEEKQTYYFESFMNQRAVFFFDAGKFVFLGDHTTFLPSDA